MSIKLFVVSVLSTIGALVRLLALNRFDIYLGFGPLYPVVMIAAIWGGLYLGLFATVLSSIYVYLSTPYQSHYIYEANSWVNTLLFTVNGIIFSLVGEILKRSYHQTKQALVQAKQLGDALDYVPTYVYIKDKTHHYLYANKPTREWLNTSIDNLYQVNDSRVFPTETAKLLHEIDNRVLLNAESTKEELTFLDKDGGLRVFWEIKIPLYENGTSGEIIGLCGISTDITERKIREDVLRESEERFHSIFDVAAIGMSIVDLTGKFIQVNKALCLMLGYSEQELYDKTFFDVTHPDDVKADKQQMKHIIEERFNNYKLEKRFIHKNGSVIWIFLTGSVVHDANGRIKYLIAQIVDITEQKLLLVRLEQQANEDYLTGLYNRRFFIEQSETEIARAKRSKSQLAILMIDLDFFKKINDKHGHQVGDVVLQSFSSALKKMLRAVDIIGRIGGEEFAIVLPQTSSKMAMEVAERIREHIEHTPVVLTSDAVVSYTISIGVLLPSNLNQSFDSMLDQADVALYQAKNNGRNRVCLAENHS